MSAPKVSIIILSYNHPEVTKICLDTLRITEGVEYEVVVVDNGSDDRTIAYLKRAEKAGLITKLIKNNFNALFSEGNNIGVRHSNHGSEYILLLNSDVGFMRSDWLEKLVGWAEGTTKYYPSVWPHHPTEPAPGPYDVVSLGWSWDWNFKDGLGVRPEGWCCLYRRSVWREMDGEDFPWLYGLDLQITQIARGGGKVGVLSQYGPYLRHREGGSTAKGVEMPGAGVPDLPAWYDDVHIESLDFTLGPNEHDSYLWW